MATSVIDSTEIANSHVVESGLLSELNDSSAPSPTGAPNVPPTTANPEPNSNVGGDWTPEERAYLRHIMDNQMRFEQNAKIAQDWLQRHKEDYYPTPANMKILTDIISQGTGQPFDMSADFDPDLMDRAVQAAIANDLLELPPAHSISEAQLQDRRVANIKQAFAEENKPEPVTPTLVRTGMFESTADPPASSGSEPTYGDLAREIAGLPLEQARAKMESLMRTASGDGPNWRTRAAERTVRRSIGY